MFVQQTVIVTGGEHLEYLRRLSLPAWSSWLSCCAAVTGSFTEEEGGHPRPVCSDIRDKKIHLRAASRDTCSVSPAV